MGRRSGAWAFEFRRDARDPESLVLHVDATRLDVWSRRWRIPVPVLRRLLELEMVETAHPTRAQWAEWDAFMAYQSRRVRWRIARFVTALRRAADEYAEQVGGRAPGWSRGGRPH